MSGAPEEDGAEADCAAFGISPAFAALPDQDTTGIWADHVPALLAFLRVTTQWRVVGGDGGGRRVIGLDYAGAKIAWDYAGTVMTPDLWAQVQMIERGARDAMNGNHE